MKLVQINRYDVTGERFNGYAIAGKLLNKGIQSTHLVWEKSSNDENVQLFLPLPGLRSLNRGVVEWETRNSRHAMSQFYTFALPLQKEFAAADVAHYHIIHDGYFDVAAMPWLSSQKPSIWTWHDPWPMTGHCLHPKGCRRWTIGCGECPDLTAHFAMRDDRTAEAFQQKKEIVSRSDVDIVVASNWMMRMAKESPIAQNARLHLIPFGLDLALYRPMDRSALRRKFGIEPGRVVVAVRAQSSIFKGLEAFVEAMTQIDTSVPICILAVQESGHMDHLLGRHQLIELGWIKDHAAMAEVMAAADLFVMPSTAESFGMMAVEAMACGAPVVVFEGTALPEVVAAPDIGVAVPLNDVSALAQAIKSLVERPEELAERGRRAREFSEREYSLDLHVDRISALYVSAAKRRGREIKKSL